MQNWPTAPLGPRQRRQGLSPAQWTGGTRIAISGCTFWAVSRWGLLGCGPSWESEPKSTLCAAGSMRGSYLEPEQGLVTPPAPQGVYYLYSPNPHPCPCPYCLLSHTSFGHPALPQGERSVCLPICLVLHPNPAPRGLPEDCRHKGDKLEAPSGACPPIQIAAAAAAKKAPS